jgi:hypothetical protein
LPEGNNPPALLSGAEMSGNQLTPITSPYSESTFPITYGCRGVELLVCIAFRFIEE